VRTRLLVAGLIAGAWLISSAPNALAHAELLGTTPSNGEHLAAAPTEVVLRFSETVSPVRDGTSLLDGRGKRLGAAQAESLDGDSTKIRLPLPNSLPAGVYSVTWRVVSADSHPVHGAFVFSVGDAQAAPLAGAGAESGADPVVAVAFWLFRWLGFAAVALLIGGVFFALACWPAGRTDRRLRRIVRIAWWTATSASVAVLLLQGANATGAPILSALDPGQILDTVSTNFGIFVLARLAALAVAVFLLTRPDIKLVALAVAAVALLATWSASGHAVVGAWVPFALLTDVAHLLAMSLWLGGLVFLVACVLPGRKLRPAETGAVLSQFSKVALISVAVLAGTGVLMAVREVGLSGLLSGSRYVTLVVFKAGAFGLVLWLAAMSRTSVQRQLVEPARKGQSEAINRLRRSVLAETGIAVVVLGLTAALVATPPTDLDAEQAQAAVSTGPFLSALDIPANGDVQVWVSPARTGDNQVVVNVRDERGINRDVPEVTAQLSLPAAGIGPLPVPLSKTSAGQYVAEKFTVPTKGVWRLTVRVRTSELDASTVDADVPVQ
jgi:copper transport protein